METKPGELYLGALLDPAGARGELLVYEAADLTTHGVIVGMTGSGKTGLAVGLLEETLLSGIPCLIIDPKGDMTNLLLNFPQFRPEDFEPWVDAAAARRQGIERAELAARTATQWKEGLAGWQIDPTRMQRLKEQAEFVIYTPGSTAGVAVNVLGSLAVPATTDPEAIRDEIEGFVSSLLVLAGIESDPISGPEHILLATIIETAWSQGQNLDLATLIGQVQQPPFRKLGVFEIDAFIPPKARTALAMKLNGLAASPSFAAWREGAPLDIHAMLFEGEATKAPIFYLAHLSDDERQFFVTLLLSKLVTYLRSQSSGTSDLKALVYMDEIAGFCPPTAEPPSKKPILTIAKQARAFGFGMVLTTQNPMDFDYKVMSNAGTWAVGRLQTERDKARILEGMQSATGEVDLAALDTQISGLDKRQFVLHTTGGKPPRLFTTRWVMSYLAGPLTKDQVATLAAGRPSAPAPRFSPEPGQSEPSSSGTELSSEDVLPVVPPVAPGIAVGFLDPAATWASQVGARGSGSVWRAMVAAAVNLLYDDAAAKLEHREVYEAIVLDPAAALEATNLLGVDHDPRDFAAEAPTGARFEVPPAGIDKPAFWKKLATDLTDYLVASRPVTIWKNPELKLFSRVGESESEFRARCITIASEAADEAVAGLREKYRLRIDRAREAVATARRRADDLAADVDARKQEEILSGAGDLLGALLGGRRRSTISRAASRRSQTRRTQARLETAQGAVDGKLQALADLEADLADEVLAIESEFDDKAAYIEEVEIPLEKVDVKVAELRLIWVPV
ncbi:MAG TPA: DUF87 domain-containing protein [Acidimicrobiia bacterium]|nr:DUF87 domain-containing protein [Acidimicrobiia bacterium]